ncbi:hypothetical protein NE471_27015, partial [Escherichia coli]
KFPFGTARQTFRNTRVTGVFVLHPVAGGHAVIPATVPGQRVVATTLMFEGVPNWPTPARMAQVVDKHQVNILYTAPTAIRTLMAEGDKAIEGTDRSSLRIL